MVGFTIGGREAYLGGVTLRMVTLRVVTFHKGVPLAGAGSTGGGSARGVKLTRSGLLAGSNSSRVVTLHRGGYYSPGDPNCLSQGLLVHPYPPPGQGNHSLGGKHPLTGGKRNNW